MEREEAPQLLCSSKVNAGYTKERNSSNDKKNSGNVKNGVVKQKEFVPSPEIESFLFLLQMSKLLEDQNNLAESVKSMESALLFYRANRTIIDHILFGVGLTANNKNNNSNQTNSTINDPDYTMPYNDSDTTQNSIGNKNNNGVNNAHDRDSIVKFYLNKFPLLKKNNDAGNSGNNDPSVTNSKSDDTGENLLVPLNELCIDYVLRCNSYAVAEFNSSRYEAALFFIHKALFITDVRTQQSGSATSSRGPDTSSINDSYNANNSINMDDTRLTTSHLFLEKSPAGSSNGNLENAEIERLRLRAATFNNLGCMERRRGQLEKSLQYLKEAARIEVRIADGTAALHAGAESDINDDHHTNKAYSNGEALASPSTYLNLCTVYNELGNHEAAVIAVEQSITGLQRELAEETDEDSQQQIAMMLAVGLYNLGVSLERRNRTGDFESAQQAYLLCLQTCRQYLVDPRCPTVDAAVEAIRRMGGGTAAPARSREDFGSNSSNVNRMHSSTSRADTAAGAAVQRVRDGEAAADTPFAWTRVPKPKQGKGNTATVEEVHSSAAGHSPSEGVGRNLFGPGPNASGADRRRLPSLSLKEEDIILSHDVRSGMAEMPNTSAPPKRPWTASAPAARPPLATEPTPVSEIQLSLPDARLPLPPASFRRPSSALITRGSHQHTPLLPSHSSSRGPSSRVSSGRLPHVADARVKPGGDGDVDGRGQPSRQRPFTAFTSESRTALTAAPSTEINSRDSNADARGRPAAKAPSHSTQIPPRPPSQSATKGANKRSVLSKGGDFVNRSLSAKTQRTNTQTLKQGPKRDSKMVKRLRNKMVEQTLTHEQRIERAAATLIQRTWRGVQTREKLRMQIYAAFVIQRVFRGFAVRLARQRQREKEESDRLEVIRLAIETEAARVIQKCARQFLRRCKIHRDYLARHYREHVAARTIQRSFRDYLERKRKSKQEKLEARQREEAAELFRANRAARKIQEGFRGYQERCALRQEEEEERQREAAAIVLQSHMRGKLTRSWYSYFKIKRKEEILVHIANTGRITIVQAFLRCIESQQEMVKCCQVYASDTLNAIYTDAAIKIQNMWRGRVARIHLERLQAERVVQCRHAERIIGWYQMCKLRSSFLQHLEQKRHERAAAKVQRFYRRQKRIEKEKQFAAYYAAQLEKERYRRTTEQYAPVIQAYIEAKVSEAVVSSEAKSWLKWTRAAMLWQRVGRGFLERVDLHLLKHTTEMVLAEEKVEADQLAAALVLQRAWRCAAAKSAVETRRREKAAVRLIENNYKVYQAKRELRTLREAKQLKEKNAAARVIQGYWRAQLEQRQLREMSAYYALQHEKKVEKQRRTEAAVIIQTAWRGCVARRKYAELLQEHRRRDAAALKIQDAWFKRKYREQFRGEIELRAIRRSYRQRAVLAIQCFWRKATARERARQLRQHRAIKEHCATVVQSWYRMCLAKREVKQRRAERAAAEMAVAKLEALWEHSTVVVQAFVRSRWCALTAVKRRRDNAFEELNLMQKVEHIRRLEAATKIQAMYRGHYDRAWVRGYKREKAEEAAQAEARRQLEHRSAVTIQSAYRQYRSRQEVDARRQARLAELEAEHQQYLLTSDPKEVVRELFLLHDALESRDTSAERLERLLRQQAAATKIQQAYRMSKSLKLKRVIADHKKEHQAAAIILSYYRRYRLRKMMELQQEREKAVTVMQRYVRGWLVRRAWLRYREGRKEAQRLELTQQDLYDTAAVVIQCAWRQRVARGKVRQLREERDQKKELNRQNEAATVIQRAFRAYRQRGDRQ